MRVSFASTRVSFVGIARWAVNPVDLRNPRFGSPVAVAFMQTRMSAAPPLGKPAAT